MLYSNSMKTDRNIVDGMSRFFIFLRKIQNVNGISQNIHFESTELLHLSKASGQPPKELNLADDVILWVKANYKVMVMLCLVIFKR